MQDFWPYELYLVAAYAQKGDMAKAAEAKERLLRLQPIVSIQRLRAIRISDNPAYLQQSETHVLAGLCEAGILEQ